MIQREAGMERRRNDKEEDGGFAVVANDITWKEAPRDSQRGEKDGCLLS